MLKVVVVFESKYGNTKLVAEKILEGIMEGGGIQVDINDFKEVNFDEIPKYDAVLIGCPNHFGRSTRSAEKFIDKLGELSLEDKSFAVFDTYLGKDFEKAVKKMEKSINEKISKAKLLMPGLSVRVNGLKGPISEGELPKAKEFGVKIASLLKV
ncbi:MAG: flavodoxin family protein [Candidatus Bathyarchaeia archaeon]